ncbi:MAG: hypothetical protein AB1847_11145 [bacterium]
MNTQDRFTSCFKIILRTIVLICLILPLGCAVRTGPILVKDGKKYGRIEGIWGGNFWNFYERGLSYAEGEFWPLAITDFQQAVRLKGRDQRRIRTYGLHILDDYFPHREMGIAYYFSQDYQKAIQELSISLECYPSAKAKYYMNRAREASLRLSRHDTASPVVLITSHRDHQVVGGFEATIEGTAEDDYFVEKIAINGVPFLCELSQKNMPFKTIVALQQGSNEIRVAARDLLGKESVKILHLLADRQAPVLSIDDLSIIQKSGNEGQKGSERQKDSHEQFLSREIHLEGYVDDLCGVKTFQIEHQPVALETEKGGRFHFNTLLPESLEALAFVAEDQAGNRVEGQIKLKDFLSAHSSSSRLLQVASLRMAGLAAQNNDTQPPTLRIDTPKGDLTVEWETLFISGEVQDAGGIRDLLIDDESILPREGRMIYFNHLLKLKEGKNSIIIKAIDTAGNEKIKTIEVERTVHPVRQIASRMSVAICPLSYRGEDNQKRGLMTDLLTNAFEKQERFLMVDRQRIDRIVRQLEEQGDTDFSPQEVGKLVSAESVLAGRIYEDKGFVEIVARLVDTETSVILDSEDVYGEGGLRSIRILLNGLALKFKQSFPLVEGEIMEKDGRNILVDIGREKNIKEYTKFIIFREGKSSNDPITQKILEFNPYVLGEAKILKVFDQFSEAGLISKEQQESVRIKDHVITK